MNSTDHTGSDLLKIKRDQYAVEIRKSKSLQLIQNKRAKLVKASKSKSLTTKEDLEKAAKEITSLCCNFHDASKANDTDMMSKSIFQIREVVSMFDHPPIEALYNANIIPHLLHFLGSQFYAQTQLLTECTWILVNFATGETMYIDYLVDNNIINLAMDLVSHPEDAVKDNALWLLSNIAGECVKYRDMIWGNRKLVSDIETLVEKKKGNDPIFDEVAWLLSNLCRGSPAPDFGWVTPFFPTIDFLIQECTRSQALKYTLQTLSLLANSDMSEQIEELLNLNIVERIVELLDSSDYEIILPAVTTLGRLFLGEDEQVSYIISQGVIEPLVKLLRHSKKIVVKEATWALSNLCASGQAQIQEFLDFENGKGLDELFELVKGKEGDNIAQEAIFCFTNIADGGNFDQIQVLVSKNVFSIFADSLKTFNNTEVLIPCLQSIEFIMEASREHFKPPTPDRNPYLDYWTETNLYAILEDLILRHKNTKIFQLAARLLEQNASKGMN